MCEDRLAPCGYSPDVRIHSGTRVVSYRHACCQHLIGPAPDATDDDGRSRGAPARARRWALHISGVLRLFGRYRPRGERNGACELSSFRGWDVDHRSCPSSIKRRLAAVPRHGSNVSKSHLRQPRTHQCNRPRVQLNSTAHRQKQLQAEDGSATSHRRVSVAMC